MNFVLSFRARALALPVVICAAICACTANMDQSCESRQQRTVLVASGADQRGRVDFQYFHALALQRGLLARHCVRLVHFPLGEADASIEEALGRYDQERPVVVVADSFAAMLATLHSLPGVPVVFYSSIDPERESQQSPLSADER